MENGLTPSGATAQSGELRPVRTYERDVEEVLHGENISLSKIALAESVKRRAPPPPSVLSSPMRIRMPQPAGAAGDGRRFRSLFLFGIPTVIFASAIALAWYFWGNAGGEDTTATFKPPVTQTEDAGIVLSGEQRTAFIKRVRDEIANTQVPLGEFRILPLKKKTGEQITEPLPLAELLGVLEASAPPSLVRALATEPLFGIHGIRGNQPFLLFTVASYDHAFGGMLLWEKEMLEDIGPLFGVNPRVIQNAPATTTAEALARRLAFRDVVVRNKDLRAVFDNTGRIIFLYSFLDKQSLLITTNDETLKAVLPKVSRGALR